MAGPYYVDPSGGNDANTGLSFAQAYLTTQKALDVAVADSQIFLCQTATETTAVIIDADTNVGGVVTPVEFISYNATGTAELDGYILQASAAITAVLELSATPDYLKFKGVIFDANSNATYALYNNVDTALFPTFTRCSFINATSHGVNVRGLSVWNFFECSRYVTVCFRTFSQLAYYRKICSRHGIREGRVTVRKMVRSCAMLLRKMA